MPTVVREIAARHALAVGREWAGGHALAVGREIAAVHRIVGVVREISAWHSLTDLIGREVAASHLVVAVAVAREIAGRHDIGGLARVAREIVTRHALRDADVLAVSVAVTVDGQTVDPAAVSISGDRDSFCWSLTLTLRDLADWRTCAPGAGVAVMINGQSWAFVLESRDRDRSFGSTGYTASGRSPTIALDAPLAAPVTRTWGRITAREAAQELCDAAGVALVWEACDWTLPAGRLTADEQSPIEIVSALAGACGAVAQSTPAGALRVIHAYPVPVPEFAGATPALALSDVDHVFTATENYEHREGYGAVVVTDAASVDADASIRIEVDEDLTGKTAFAPGDPVFLRVTSPVPYTLRATSGILALIAADQTDEVAAETVEFPQEETADAAEVVDEVLDVDWFGLDPGGLAADGVGGLKLLAGAGFGVGHATYSTRYDVWQFTPADLGEEFPVLILAEEVTA